MRIFLLMTMLSRACVNSDAARVGQPVVPDARLRFASHPINASGIALDQRLRHHVRLGNIFQALSGRLQTSASQGFFLNLELNGYGIHFITVVTLKFQIRLAFNISLCFAIQSAKMYCLVFSPPPSPVLIDHWDSLFPKAHHSIMK